jgi:hypothetical protein
MKLERHQIWSAVVLCCSGGFLVLALYVTSLSRGSALQYAETKSFGGREVDVYKIKGFENLVVSISRANPISEIVIMDTAKSVPSVTVAMLDGGVQAVTSYNSPEDYVVVRAGSKGVGFSRLDRVTPSSQTTLRGQLDLDLDGVMDKEVEIPR